MWVSRQTVESLGQNGTDVHRVATVAEFTIDRFSRDFLISLRGDFPATDAATELQTWLDGQDITHPRIFVRRLAANALQTEATFLLSGQSGGEDKTHVRENGLVYGIDFLAGRSPGLFVDQRENRRFLQSLRPARVLNCFAYTCAFSVAAAQVGSETLSVDLSKKWLDRGRENFGLNGMPLSGHRFFADDVREVLRRLCRRGERFDAIILDPPTFARGKGGVFRVEKELGSLLDSALGCLADDGSILLSTNYTRWGRGGSESARA